MSGWRDLPVDGRIMSVPRCRPAGDRQTRGSLTACLQLEPGDPQDPGSTLTGMNNMYGTPAGPRSFPAGGPGPEGLPEAGLAACGGDAGLAACGRGAGPAACRGRAGPGRRRGQARLG